MKAKLTIDKFYNVNRKIVHSKHSDKTAIMDDKRLYYSYGHQNKFKTLRLGRTFISTRQSIERKMR